MTSSERHEARYQRRKATREAKRREFAAKYDNFDRATSVSALIKAHWEARKGVLWKASVVRYNTRFFKSAVNANIALQRGEDIRQGFYSFYVMERGERRDIHSLHYAERVIRRSICINAMVPLLSHNLIYDNGASLEGKGVSFSIDRCKTHLRRFWRENGNDGYILIIDFRRYFDNIEHSNLLSIYDRYIQDSRLNALCRSFVTITGDKGLYIGPEDSQIDAIAYPNKIDHLVKDQWGLKYYGRYMDDSYIILQDKNELMRYRDLLFAEYERMGIKVNVRKTQIIKLRHGFTFLKTRFFLTESGHVVMKPDHNNIVRQRRKLKSFVRFVRQGEMTIQQVNTAYMSWRGYICSKNAYRTVTHMDALYYSLFKVKPWEK